MPSRKRIRDESSEEADVLSESTGSEQGSWDESSGSDDPEPSKNRPRRVTRAQAKAEQQKVDQEDDEEAFIKALEEEKPDSEEEADDDDEFINALEEEKPDSEEEADDDDEFINALEEARPQEESEFQLRSLKRKQPRRFKLKPTENQPRWSSQGSAELRAKQETDPITCEPLDSRDVVCVTSPDGRNTVFYNAITLKRIAEAKGRWMQPPHFRESMSPDLIRQVEALVGVMAPASGPAHPLMAEVMHAPEFGDLVGAWNQLGQVLLDSTEIYICPCCYSKLKHCLDETGEPSNAEADPLEIVRRKGLEKLPHFAFSSAKAWRDHLKEFHPGTNLRDFDCSDFKLKQLVYNWLQRDCEESEIYKSGRQVVRIYNEGKAVTRVAAEQSATQGSIQVYWSSDSRYNTDLYNDIVATVNAGQVDEDPPFSPSSSESSGAMNEFLASDDDEAENDTAGLSHLEVEAMLREKEQQKRAAEAEEAEASLCAVQDLKQEEDWNSDELSDVEEVHDNHMGSPLDMQKGVKKRTGRGPQTALDAYEEEDEEDEEVNKRPDENDEEEEEEEDEEEEEEEEEPASPIVRKRLRKINSE